MTSKRITDLAAAAALTGAELVEVTQLSAAVTITAATLSALAVDNSFNDSANGFVTAGFAVGDRVKVSGFTGNVANNILVGILTAVTAGKLTVGGADGNVIVDDAAGESVTITKWVSRRVTSALLVPAASVDNDVTLAGDSTTVPPSVHAVRGYVGTAVTGLLDLKGSTDCSANPNYPAASKGDFYIVSAAGKIGGAAGTLVDVGDAYYALADNAGGTQAAVGASWAQLEHDGVYGAGATAATTTEQLTGTSTAVVSTPDSTAALWEQGADVASAATVSLGDGGYFNITGTTGITDIDFATDRAGRAAWVKFAGILTLTHSATLIMPTGANVATAAGDTACFVSEGSDVVRCVAYQRASGLALAAGAGGSSVTAVKDALYKAMAEASVSMTVGGSKYDVRIDKGGIQIMVLAALVDSTGVTGSTYTIPTGYKAVVVDIFSDSRTVNEVNQTAWLTNTTQAKRRASPYDNGITSGENGVSAKGGSIAFNTLFNTTPVQFPAILATAGEVVQASMAGSNSFSRCAFTAYVIALIDTTTGLMPAIT